MAKISLDGRELSEVKGRLMMEEDLKGRTGV
jgi:hypothetical protein